MERPRRRERKGEGTHRGAEQGHRRTSAGAGAGPANAMAPTSRLSLPPPPPAPAPPQPRPQGAVLGNTARRVCATSRGRRPRVRALGRPGFWKANEWKRRRRVEEARPRRVWARRGLAEGDRERVYANGGIRNRIYGLCRLWRGWNAGTAGGVSVAMSWPFFCYVHTLVATDRFRNLGLLRVLVSVGTHQLVWVL